MKESLSLAVYGLLEALIIIIGSVAQISSIGTKIAVERDWVVVMAGSDKDLLAGMSDILLQCHFTGLSPVISQNFTANLVDLYLVNFIMTRSV